MKLRGTVNGRNVVLLLDSKATHNFISSKLVEELKLPIMPTTFVVTLGDERKVKGARRCDKME